MRTLLVGRKWTNQHQRKYCFLAATEASQRMGMIWNDCYPSCESSSQSTCRTNPRYNHRPPYCSHKSFILQATPREPDFWEDGSFNLGGRSLTHILPMNGQHMVDETCPILQQLSSSTFLTKWLSGFTASWSLGSFDQKSGYPIGFAPKEKTWWTLINQDTRECKGYAGTMSGCTACMLAIRPSSFGKWPHTSESSKVIPAFLFWKLSERFCGQSCGSYNAFTNTRDIGARRTPRDCVACCMAPLVLRGLWHVAKRVVWDVLRVV